MIPFFGGYMLIVFIIILLLYLIITYLMFIFICKKFKKNDFMVMHKAIEKSLEPYKDQVQDGKNWVMNQKSSNVFIKSNDNLKLHGLFIEKYEAKGIIILAHGYRSGVETDLFPSCKNYYEMGYSILLIDERGSGNSEGKYITFGVKESEDIISWCNYLNKKYKNMSIIFGGISMGATAVLMASRYLNDKMNVKCIIADSPYIYPYDEVLYCFNHYFHVDGKLFIGIINIWCMLFAKFSLKERSVIRSLKDKEIPILLIHGEDDDFVPMINSKIIYEKYNGKKKLITFPKATHGMSYLVDSKRYINEIRKFLR